MSLLTDNIHCKLQFEEDSRRISTIEQTSVTKEQTMEKQLQLFRMNSLNNESTQISSDVVVNRSLDLSYGDAMEDSLSEDDDVDITPVTYCRRRMALADIFENVNENEMVTLLSLYVRHEVIQRKWLHRRGGKSNILEGLTCEEITAIRACACYETNDEVPAVKCDVCLSHTDDTDVSTDDDYDNTLDVSSTLTVALRNRRAAKFDIFEGLTEIQRQNVLDRFHDYLQCPHDSMSESEDEAGEINEPENEYRGKNQRRGGKCDIFEGLTEDERVNIIQKIVKNCCDDSTIPKVMHCT